MHTAKSGGRHDRCDPCSLPTGLDPAVAYLGFGLEDRPFDRLPCSLPPGSRSRIRTGVRGSPSWRRYEMQNTKQVENDDGLKAKMAKRTWHMETKTSDSA
ncbi:hypothetical protein C4D60_Mb08t07340 [Musa balbisiana]|uniref:Uncharacterized protein n=1 Tax=Musa balbisiana TaxID=52838 RepID=A0A4S8K225_MUSBA|nr:hypothetical protein C4D60_Mb08t07340 [Musa balbisiana]